MTAEMPQKPIRACVIGWPIEHSRSPLIHGHWLKAYAIDGTYEKVAVEPERAEAFIKSLADRGFSGCNVTVPLKEIAFRAADVREPSAVAVGAANTLWLKDGLVHAGNTDTYGFMTHLRLSAPQWKPCAGPVAILGAGGAARAIVHGFRETGAPEIVVFNRTRARAEELVASFQRAAAPTGGATVEIRVADWEERVSSPGWASVIVNTTTIGMNGDGDLGLDYSNPRRDCVVCDIVYVPLETKLLARARDARLATVDGLGMLLHQAVPGFEKWFGVRPEVTDDLRSLILRDLGVA